ncbi:MAG: hypothetical protein HY22_04135 [[Candidatus Thermochlorobacteriaceae] bacterium GBChlB]|nr:MAG: hypothetical protein HY22_04135 [[Candidatus Thermochlorobacteriaceae] bacterium GBChlB]
MGIAERKAREKEEMRQRILEAAMSLFIAEGYENVSIRQIADKIEYSPATIYLYFKDKEALFCEIQEAGFKELCRRQEALRVVQDPMERLNAHGRAYIRFAIENPHYYDLMFLSNMPMVWDSQFEGSSWGMRSFNYLKSDVQACIEAGEFKPVDVMLASMALWSLVHGISSFIITHRWDMIPKEHLENYAFDILQLGVAGMQHL